MSILPPPYPARELNILLADDDKDDCMFFKEALEELELSTQLTTVHDGEQLMKHLTSETNQLPDVLFLDINMPRKNGLTCLKEIKCSESLKALPVIILSTSYDEHIADQLYKNGAQHFICKPTDFSQLKKLIQQALDLVAKENTLQPPRAKFLLSPFKVNPSLI